MFFMHLLFIEGSDELLLECVDGLFELEDVRELIDDVLFVE